MGFKRPLVWLLFSYLAGMGLCTLQVPITGVILVLFLLIFFLFIYFIYPIHFIKHKLKNCNFLFITPIFLILGYMLLTKQLQPSSMDIIFESKMKGSVTGRLITIEEKEDYNLLTFKDNLVSTYSNSNSQTYHINKIIIYDSDKLNYKIGNTILVSGQIIKFQKASNPGQFDEYLYYKTNNIDYKVYADEVEILDSDYSRFFQFLFELKRKFIGIYYKILPIKNAGVLSAMILGEKALLDSEVKQLYQQNGISHILSISGLHISLLGITLYKLLRKIRISLFPSTLISVFIIVSYGILTNFSVSTNRAVVMLIIFMGADLIGRTYDIISATALSALIICIISPLQIINAGFLLSFGAILGIGVFYPIISSYIPMKNFIIDGLFVSFSIQVITTPILLYFFYEIPTYSMLINMIILPVSSIIVLIAVLSGLIGCFILPISLFLIGSVHYILNFYELVCRIGRSLPKNSIISGRPSLTVIFTYYCIIILFIVFNNKVKKKRSMLLVTLLAIIFIKPTKIDFKVTFLDVGQGDGIFMMAPNKISFLIDGGSTDIKSIGQYRILPFLKYNGIGKIDYAIITHTDNDHISGIKELISNMEQNSLWIKHLVLPNINSKDESYKELVSLANSNGVEVLYIEKGDAIKAGDVVITCIHPYIGYQSDSKNDASTVLSVNYKQFDMLLTGDIEAKGEEAMIEILKENESNLDNSKEDISYQMVIPNDYDILKVAHHGSKYSTQAELLNIIKPEYAIISCSKENSYGHPHEEALDRLQAVNSNIMITKDSGAITILTDGENMVIKKYTNRE